jgi:DNA-binding MarR family transcriptional regulator
LVSSATSGLSFPKSEYVSIRELADHLLVKHHSAVGLVDRLARRGLVRRSAARADGRRVEIRLTARGEKLIQRISAAHLAELRHVEPELRRLFEIIDR